MTALAPQIPIQIPAKLLPILRPRRFKIMHGGRGGAKSHTVAQVLLAMGMQRKLRILCGREVQKSLKESSQQLLLDYIERMGLGRYYRLVNGQIVGCNGTLFSFTGLRAHTASSIKSFEGYDIVWVEEAQSVSEHSWNLLIPTILRTDGAEVWATFNSDSEEDYVYQRFVKHGDADALVIEINWRDNPWFNQAMYVERLILY
jgi:PBSX family phage terminase large subunit